MQYTVIGLDGTDDKAMERRLAARAGHLRRSSLLLESGNLLYSCALLDDEGIMKGSTYVVRFESQEEFDHWYQNEPYILGDVWQDVKIYQSRTNDPWQFNRPKEWHKNI